MSKHTDQWNQGFPTVTERNSNYIKFELLVGDAVKQAYSFAEDGAVWKDADTFEVIDRSTVSGWREPAPKSCRFGNHPIDEVADGGLVTYFTVDDTKTKTETYACQNCDLAERIRVFGETGIIRTSLLTQASLRQHEHEFIRANIGDSAGRAFSTAVKYSTRLARRLVAEERAFGSVFDETLTVAVLQIVSGAGDILDAIQYVFCGSNQYWFNRLTTQMDSVTAAGKVWEREVWFGGEDRSQDPRYTEPFEGLGGGWRAYLSKPVGHGSHFSTREDVLPPGSLQALVVPAPYKGYECVVGDVKYMSYSIVGRSMFQIENKDARVTYIVDETSPKARGSVQGIEARREDAVMLFLQAVIDWKAGRIQLTQAADVGLL